MTPSRSWKGGKQLLMTRGCLTTFSIANDVAKYFAILPALFTAAFPEIAPLNFLGEPRVNVLRSNLALDERLPAAHR